ncbi:MAG: polysaccharide deacetylase [Lachnospiraceae bacterium]|nr:polysaccharide deacetylase [Lachnospiraceae bacterium]
MADEHLTDAEKEKRRRARRVQRLKKEIPIAILTLILVPTILAIVFGIRSHQLKMQVMRLQEEMQDLERILDQQAEQEALYYGEYTGNGTVITDSEESDVILSGRTGIDTSVNVEGVSSGKRHVYLTFDDGPSLMTDKILEILDDYGVKATFFVTGKEDARLVPEYARIAEAGHTIGMHSYSHSYRQLYASEDSFKQDLNKLQEYIYDLTGVWSHYYRFPGGSSNTVSTVSMNLLIDYLNEQDIVYYDWNASCGDGASGLSQSQIYYTAIRSFDSVPEDVDVIMLLHDSYDHRSTVAALPGIIEYILAQDNTEIVPITDDSVTVQHRKAIQTTQSED